MFHVLSSDLIYRNLGTNNGPKIWQLVLQTEIYTRFYILFQVTHKKHSEYISLMTPEQSHIH